MKQIFSILSAATLLMMSACSDNEYTDRYADPSKTPTVTCEKLMTGIFVTDDYTRPTYARYFTFETQQIGVFAQTMGFINSAGRYQGMGESYNDNRWKNFYNVLTQYRLLEHTYDNVADPEENKPFLLLSKIYVYDQLQEVMSLWGDVPFSKAGYLAVTGNVASSYPSYDDDEVLYKMILDDLKSINSELAGMTNLSALTTSYLSAQDYINGGDLNKWRKYCNSLRLRVASQLAENGALVSEARTALTEMLNDPSTYPMVDSNDENIYIKSDQDGFKVLDAIREGFESWSGQCNRASKMMVDNLTGDPRLDIIYDKNAEGEYAGIDPMDSEANQQKHFDRLAEDGGNYYSAVDTATFSRNEGFPGIVMTAAEVSFNKAEAYQKYGVSGDAKAAFEKGVKESVDFYYFLNSSATYRAVTAEPAASEVTTFAASTWDAYGSKDEAIATQKWLHFSLIDMVQAWTSVRKTGFPVLQFQTDNVTSACPNVPERLRYTTDERNNNKANYEAVQTNDTYYTKLFWAK